MVSVRADQSIVLYRVLNIYTFNNNIKKKVNTWDNRGYANGVFCDLSGAFDCGSH